jgi:hypothetical protein
MTEVEIMSSKLTRGEFVQGAIGTSASAEGTCKIVAGAISPHGWCIAYSKK